MKMGVVMLIRFVPRCVIVLIALFALVLQAADTPAPEPKPLAKVNADVAVVLEKMAAAYSKLKSVELAGGITMEADEAGQKRTQQDQFVSSFQAPNRFRHEVKNQPLFGSTGSKVYGYSSYSNLFVQADIGAAKVMLHDLPADHVKVLPMQNLSLVLALSKNPVDEIKEMASEITLMAAQKLEGTDCAALLLKLNDTNNKMMVFVDPKSFLIRRVTVDMKPMFEQIGRSDVVSASLTVDYTTVKTDTPVLAEQFAWTPPQGAKDIVAARAEALAAAQADGDSSEAANAMVGKPASDFTLEGLDGKQVTLSDLKGSVVILDFWATWCGPCVAALPHLDRIYQDNLKAGVKVYALNQREAREKVQEFVNDKHMTIPVLMDLQGEVAKQYFVSGIPQTVVIGKDGLVKKVLVGFNPDGDDGLRQLVAEELKAKADVKPAPKQPARATN
jgi:thiol-disulfide isomerase/thioredoxin/outer membrane lipoprotein-sorting protein